MQDKSAMYVAVETDTSSSMQSINICLERNHSQPP